MSLFAINLYARHIAQLALHSLTQIIDIEENQYLVFFPRSTLNGRCGKMWIELGGASGFVDLDHRGHFDLDWKVHSEVKDPRQFPIIIFLLCP